MRVAASVQHWRRVLAHEFLPSPEGTLFDTLAQQTDPATVTFQVDVFHALLGGTIRSR